MRLAHQRLVLDPARDLPGGWAHTHAALPVADIDDVGRRWIWFSPRDAEGRGHIARVPAGEDWMPGGAVELMFEPGPPGAFDDCGVTMGSVVRLGSRVLLYYTGWTRTVRVPFAFFIGMAVSDDGGASFQRVTLAPVLGRSDADPFLTAAGSVHATGSEFRMWYISALGWQEGAGGVGSQHTYVVRHARSHDGIAWTPEPDAIQLERPEGEHSHGRPCVARRDDGNYEMWWCARGEAYHLCYATSPDGLAWLREPVQLEGAGEFASASSSYPWRVPGSSDLVLYNGNDYGRAGIGLARVAP